jgi:ClpP class serine protease
MMKNSEPKKRYDKILQEIQEAVTDAHSQTKKRQYLIKKLEKRHGSRIMMYVSKIDFPIDYNDVQLIGGMLESIGQSENIDFIIQSGGGNGVVAEKIVDMIRQYCSTRFRVMIPNLAKSAATMLALGADDILMGITSEIGPIDAQIPIVQGGMTHYISAQSFVDARDRLEKKTEEAVKSGSPYQAYIAQLSALDSGFIDYCEKSMLFGQDCVVKLLCKYMLKDDPDKEQKANDIAKDLTSTSKYFSHGRTINVRQIHDVASDNCLKDLKVTELDKGSEDWKQLFELYLRAEMFLDMDNHPTQRKGKLFETSEFSMMNSYPK